MKFTVRLGSPVNIDLPREIEQPWRALKVVRDMGALPTMHGITIQLLRNGALVGEAKWNARREVHDLAAGPAWESIRVQAVIKANIAAQAIAFAVVAGTTPDPQAIATFNELKHLLRQDSEQD